MKHLLSRLALVAALALVAGCVTDDPALSTGDNGDSDSGDGRGETDGRPDIGVPDIGLDDDADDTDSGGGTDDTGGGTDGGTDTDIPGELCGNGRIDRGEACDDGNNAAGDGCAPDCTLETSCGDGVLDRGEQCDDGNNAAGDGCAPDCTREPECGNGIVERSETCDDGNLTNGDGCSASCSREGTCGDGVVDTGEACDDGNRVGGDGCAADCTIEGSCGDGVLDRGEACDDGNTIDGDGCAADCTLEGRCGDGVVDEGEECDDGNRTAGDGCGPSCRRESACGDGRVGAGEECDDGNRVDGDGCAADCTIESFCGDGVVAAGEECDDGNTTDGDGCAADCTTEGAAGWTCPADWYDTLDGCDCNCGVLDPDCDDPTQTVYNCDPGEVCGDDGLCEGGAAVPAEWTCTDAWYGGDDGCDCDCGAWDPDCDDPAATVYRCDEGQTCNADGVCVDDGSGPADGWACNDAFYGTGDGCDCDCGAYDPDCDDPAQSVFGCDAGQICNADGVCEDDGGGSDVPAGWTCAEAYYGTGDGCDCDCGAYDPDCDDPAQEVFNCGPGQFCDADGVCADDAGGGEVPAEWTCTPTYYDGLDGCDCDCGAYDPDCDDPAQTVYNCGLGGTCLPDGTCEDGGGTGGVPAEWTCSPDYWDALDGCDCDCGAYDPDCDDPSQTVYGCEAGQTCDADGACSGGGGGGDVPATWSCNDAWYDALDGCDCECGAYDPDCDDPTQDVYRCATGELCDSDGICIPDDFGGGVPDTWTCLPRYYNAGDDCDCDCGAYDPDCDDPTLDVVNCLAGEVCDSDGTCVDDGSGGVPSGWFCDPDYYDAGDDCDCECGAYDPDCNNPGLDILGCGAGEVCDLDGTCVIASDVPPGWTCDPDYYGVGDDCDCDCGVYDPDCDDPRLDILGCDVDQICDVDGTCIDGGIPSAWFCSDLYYDAGDDCDCDCGAYDPDCDDPTLDILGCAIGQVCDTDGTCIDDGSGGGVPSSWTCDPRYYGVLDGCDCDCGAYDPDCDDPTQDVIGCGFGQICDFDGVCVDP